MASDATSLTYCARALLSGTYLLACVVYITITGKPPPSARSVDMSATQLFSTARRMLPPDEGGSNGQLPTYDERAFLRNVAESVVVS